MQKFREYYITVCNACRKGKVLVEHTTMNYCIMCTCVYSKHYRDSVSCLYDNDIILATFIVQGGANSPTISPIPIKNNAMPT